MRLLSLAVDTLYSGRFVAFGSDQPSDVKCELTSDFRTSSYEIEGSSLIQNAELLYLESLRKSMPSSLNELYVHTEEDPNLQSIIVFSSWSPCPNDTKLQYYHNLDRAWLERETARENT